MMAISSKACNKSKYEELTCDIESERVKELILSHQAIQKMLDCPSQALQHQQLMRDHQTNIHQYEERRWLIKKGKKHLIDFDNQQRRKMKQYFNTLDQNNAGSIGIDQLEELLFSLGLMDTREDIKALIRSVDQKKTGRIDFTDFLSMIQNDEAQNSQIVTLFKSIIGVDSKQKQQKNSSILKNESRVNFKGGFKAKKLEESGIYTQQNLIKGHTHQNLIPMDRGMEKDPSILQKYPYPKGLPFEMVVSHIRRKHMMTALNIGHVHQRKEVESVHSCTLAENTMEQIAKGQKVMQALQRMYERKLISQIKENKRASQPQTTFNRKFEVPLRLSFTHQR